ncbi:MAG TPA: DUF6298 domain-containing protein [Chthonomonadaceae bacterium]|nr:DUF6298 domain-containing protein [Chthonomonadaceae bacterium]
MLPLFLTAATVQTTAAAQPVPIRLHPENPRYFLFRGQPTVLISSAEHYGAVLNGAFDYVPYLKELHTKGLNLTRTFSGAYREVPGVFNIPNNTLAPTPEDFIAPWPRSSTPGAADGGNKFDLNQWNEAYFRRLKDFCKQAGAQRVIVEVVLFCPFYEDSLWDVSPMNARNNINGIGTMPRNEVYTLQNREMRALHEKLTRKIVEELRDFDNVYYEICNEPYFGGVTLDWQHHIADTITETEKAFPHKHLIAQNIANGSAKIENPHPAVSIFNFHYASPPDAVRINWNLNKPIAFDESGFKGTEDAVYRQQAWEFLLAGGSIFDHLDYSFTAAHPDGTAPVVEPTPGGGSATLRRQLKILKDFLTNFDFLKMAPDETTIQGGLPEGATAYCLAQPGTAYAIFVRGGNQASLALSLPAGRYRAEWLNPRTGAIEKTEETEGGSVTLASPPYIEDIALRVKRI